MDNVVLRGNGEKLILMSISGVLRYTLININFPFQCTGNIVIFIKSIYCGSSLDLASGSIKSSEGWTRQNY